jgi:hypothetical protein
MGTDVQPWRGEDEDVLQGEEIVELRRLPDIEPRRLAALANKIRDELDAADVAFADGVQRAIRAGELLVEAKALVGHGGWSLWLEENFPHTAQWARACMRLARRREELQSESALSVSAALAQLAGVKAAPEPPATNLFGETDPRMQEDGDDWVSGCWPNRASPHRSARAPNRPPTRRPSKTPRRSARSRRRFRAAPSALPAEPTGKASPDPPAR